ncbi:MAG TPA: tRNA pseudouridine(55) synthase TruB [Micromonosporaceae bacterium]|nr:tRNA pseudouridine(55) synthase TruB [Micromonosporaceae bacterium]
MSRDGLIVVDKPGGMTSHDVVARIRRIAGTRRVGHGGTLDPMATGVLVIGVERATRLLTYLVGADKSYTATVRLGATTVTDDAEGEVTAWTSPSGLTEAAVRKAAAGFVGEIDQVPSAVSAIKVGGVRSYARARRGEAVALAPRRVRISRLDVVATRAGTAEGHEVFDVDIEVDCSSGTYVRAIARDLGAVLGVGGHLIALRRTAVGSFTLAEAVTLEELAQRPEPVSIPLATAVARCLPRRDVDAALARTLSHGGTLPAAGIAGPYGVFAPDGRVVGIVSERSGRARAEVVLAPAEASEGS